MDLRRFETDKEKELFVKEVYDFCESVNWDWKKTDEYGISQGTLGVDIRQVARLYVKQYMGLTIEEQKIKLKEINNILRKSMLEHQFISLSKNNEILAEKGIVTQKLWTNDEEKKIVLEYIYKYCESVKYKTLKLEELGQKIGIKTITKILKLSEMYATTYLGISSQEFNARRKELINESSYDRYKYGNQDTAIKRLYRQLLKEEDIDKQIELIRNSGYTITELKAKAFDWSVTCGQNDDCELLREIINNYSKKLKEEKEERRKLQIEKEKEVKVGPANELIKRFISSRCSTIDSFCDEESIDKKEFNQCLQIVSEKNPELYSDYSEKQEKLKSSKYAVLLSIAKSITAKMITGIPLEDGRTRPFDIVDYFQATKMTYEALLNITKSKLLPDEIRSFKSFISKNRVTRGWSSNDVEKCYESKHIIGFSTDEKGRVISFGHELTREEKENIIRSIRELNIPLCDNTYHCMTRRYNKGFLSFDKEKNKVLKKNSN